MSQAKGPENDGSNVDPNKKTISPFGGEREKYPGFIDDICEYLGNLGPTYEKIFRGENVVATAANYQTLMTNHAAELATYQSAKMSSEWVKSQGWGNDCRTESFPQPRPTEGT